LLGDTTFGLLVDCLVAANPESERYCIHNL
ncbi:MAG: hypothetical protein ACI8QG_002257, partial [Flavobacteriales bacterium]